MTQRLSKEREAGIVAAIKAGKLRTIIATETGISVSAVNYIAAKHGLTIASPYNLRTPGSYWRRYFANRGVGIHRCCVSIDEG